MDPLYAWVHNDRQVSVLLELQADAVERRDHHLRGVVGRMIPLEIDLQVSARSLPMTEGASMGRMIPSLASLGADRGLWVHYGTPEIREI